MDVNVREVMAEPTTYEPTFSVPKLYKGVKPVEDMRNAFRRLEMLKDMLKVVEEEINMVPVGATEGEWIAAYELLNKAFGYAIAEEKRIIARA